jgi:capsule polysaccharide export protein KpsE/RkpR
MRMLMDKQETSKITSRDKEVLSIGSAGVELISNSYEFDESQIDAALAQRTYRAHMTESRQSP